MINMWTVQLKTNTYKATKMHDATWVTQELCVEDLYWWCSSLYDMCDVQHRMTIIPESNSITVQSDNHLKREDI